MKYISVAETAKRWGVSERSVRGYCAEGKIDDAFLTGKTWNIPETAEKPDRINKKTDTPKTLLEVLKAEKAAKLHGGIYHKIQIDLTYNSNHIEGSHLTTIRRAISSRRTPSVYRTGRSRLTMWSRPPTISSALI